MGQPRVPRFAERYRFQREGLRAREAGVCCRTRRCTGRRWVRFRSRCRGRRRATSPSGPASAGPRTLPALRPGRGVWLVMSSNWMVWALAASGNTAPITCKQRKKRAGHGFPFKSGESALWPESVAKNRCTNAPSGPIQGLTRQIADIARAWPDHAAARLLLHGVRDPAHAARQRIQAQHRTDGPVQCQFHRCEGEVGVGRQSQLCCRPVLANARGVQARDGRRPGSAAVSGSARADRQRDTAGATNRPARVDAARRSGRRRRPDRLPPSGFRASAAPASSRRRGAGRTGRAARRPPLVPVRRRWPLRSVR